MLSAKFLKIVIHRIMMNINVERICHIRNKTDFDCSWLEISINKDIQMYHVRSINQNINVNILLSIPYN
jgi:hypothetical protein